MRTVEHTVESRARIAGKLDMIRDTDGAFEILLESGETVRGVWTPGEIEPLQALFRKDVLIEGTAVYRRSGSLLRMEADAIRPAGAADKLFRTIPTPLAPSTRPRTTRRPQTPTTGASAIFGRWPGEETEEELLPACEEAD